MTESQPPGAPPAPSRTPRLLLRRTLVVLAAGTLLLVTGVLSLRVPVIGTAVANLALRRIALLPGAVLSVREARGDWLSHLEMRGLRLAGGGLTYLSADTLRLRYRLWPPRRAGLEVRSAELAGATVDPRLFKVQRPPPKRPRRRFTLDDVLHGRFYAGPRLTIEHLLLRDVQGAGRGPEASLLAALGDSTARVSSLRLRARHVVLGDGFAFELDTLAMRLRPVRGSGDGLVVTVRASLQRGRLELAELSLRSPASDVLAQGAIEYARTDSLPDVWLAVDAAPLDLADLSAFAGAPDSGAAALAGSLRARVELRGSSLDSVSGTVRAELPRARIAAMALGQVRLESTLERGLAGIVLDGDVEGAPVGVRGWVRPLDSHPGYELRAAAPRLPARIPGLPWWPALAERAPFAIELRARGHGFAGMVADFEGAARGAAGELRLDGRLDLAKGLAWEVRRLEAIGLDLARLAGHGVESHVAAVLRARGERGPRGQQRASARLDLGASSWGRWQLESGRALAALDDQRGGASLLLAAPGGASSIDTLTWRMDGASVFRVRGARLRIADLGAFTGNAALTGRLEAGAELEGSGLASLAGPTGGVRAVREGRLRARGRLELSPSAFRGRAIEGGRFDLALTGGEATLRGELRSDAGRLAVEAASRPFDRDPVHRLFRLRFDGLDLAAWLGNETLRSRLGGALTAQARGVPPGRGPGGEPWNWSAKLDLERSHVGPLAFERGEWTADGRGDDARVHGRLDVHGGAIALEADLHSAGDASTAFARLELPFSVLPALAGRDSLRAEGRLGVTVDASGRLTDPGAMRASGRVLGRGSVERARVDSLLLDFHLARGTVTVDTLTLASNVAVARASGRLALTDPSEGGPPEKFARFHAEADLRDPSLLAPLLGADSLSIASGSLVLDVAGPARDRAFTLRSELRTLLWDGVRVKRAVAAARGRVGGSGQLIEATASAEADWMTIGGLRVPLARLQLTGDSRNLRWSGQSALRDRDSLSLAGTFQPDSAGWALTLDRLDLRADSTLWRLAELARLDVRGSRMTFGALEIASARGRITAEGTLDRAGSQDFHLELRDVGLGMLASVGHLAGTSGTLSGRLDVTGPAAEPRARGNLRASLLAQGKAAGVLGSDFDWTREGFDLTGAFASPERDSIVLTSHLPIAFTMVPPEPGTPPGSRIGAGRAEIRLRADQFPLPTLQPLLTGAGVGAIDGTLDMDLRLSGRGSDLQGEGRAAVTGGKLDVPGLGIKASELRLLAAWNGDRLVLQAFHALTGKGRLDASGSLRFASLTRIEPDLTFKADRAAVVDTKELRMVATGDLHLGGSLTEPVLKGRLRFGGSHLLIAQETLADPSAKVAVALSPEDLRTLEETFTYVEPVTPDPLLGLYDASDLDLTIVLDRNNWIRQTAEPRLSVEVFGEVRMRKKPGEEPLLVGRLEPLPGRGYLEQFGRSFALTGGEVLLNGPMSSHTLDIRAQYPSERDAMSREENDVVVHLDLQGTLEKMRLVFSSEPPLSETEIITFIATGRSPTTRTGQPTDMGSEAVNLGVDMGMAMVSGALEDAAKGSVGLDVLKVGYDGVQGTTLIAGRYVAPQLYVGFRQPLQSGNTSGTNLDESTDTKVELEYAAYRWLVLNVQGESSFIRSYLRFRREY